MSLVSSWLCGVCTGFTALPPSVPGIYTQPRVRVSAYVVLPCSQGSLNGLSAVPRWQEPWKQVKWSTVLLSRGRAPKSPVLFPLPPRTARPNLHFQPRVLPPCQPGPWRHRRPRWKASSIGSMSGRPTIRKPRAGKDSTWGKWGGKSLVWRWPSAVQGWHSEAQSLSSLCDQCVEEWSENRVLGGRASQGRS